ncbi:MAG: S8 family serine peptidase [Candidatus Marinimicrobia bacterium]|jgi:hypothetical protein|nr:S8 family serine peptidase [Candidatus Neomarinimicrobiota bacterium]
MSRVSVVLLIIGVLLSASREKYRSDTFLFCMNKSHAPIIINHFDGSIKTGFPKLDNLLQRYSIEKIEPWLKVTLPTEHSGDIYLNRIYRVYFPLKNSAVRAQFKIELESLSLIHSVELEPLHYPLFTPNDPQYSQQWFLSQIDADDAWNLWNIDGGSLPGNRDVLLASVDTGVDWDHVDLVENMWNNLGEDANGNGVTMIQQGGNWILDPGDINGLDEDGNGYADDLIGWDAAGYSGLQDNNPNPPSNVSNGGTWAHGTHVAGLLSASTHNYTGIASVGFNCSIMGVKVSTGEQSYPYITHGYEGILYAAKAGFYNNNFTIINNSWGGIGYNQYEQAVIDVAHNDYGAVIVAAAGNGDENNLGTDEFAHYPSSYNHVISVCAMGSNNTWNHWATYHSSVDLASPGEGIRSTRINDGYTSWSGSSMASPIAAGTIGLLRSLNMNWNNKMLETMILATADPVIYEVNTESYLQDKLGKGRVDALQAVSTPLFPKFEMVGTDIFLPDNPGGVITPGSNLEVMVILLNDENWGTATNISTILSSQSTAITVTNPEITFDDAYPGMPILNDGNPFMVHVGSQAGIGEIGLILTLTSNEDGYVSHEAEFTFTIMVEAGNQVIAGDVNLDGEVNILDVVITANTTLGQAELTTDQFQAADVNGDGTINILDIVQIVNLILE